METRNQKRLREERERNEPVVYLHSLVYKNDPDNEIQTRYYSMCRAELEVGGKKYFVKDMKYVYFPQYIYERNYRQHIIRFQVEDEYYMLFIRPKLCPYKKNGEEWVNRLYSTAIIEKLVKTKSADVFTSDYERLKYKLLCPNVVKKYRSLCVKQRRKTLKKTIYDIGFCKDVAGLISEYVM